jgi:succinyl-CoA synthetase alpha subunit
MFRDDPDTELVVLLGEIGGYVEEEAAEYLRNGYPKPVITLIVGKAAPPGQKMGHAGAIIQQGRGTAQDKIAALKQDGAIVANSPREIPLLIRKVM